MAPQTPHTILKIMEISHRKSLTFEGKLKRILREVLACMNTECGSIMLLRGRRTLEVVASTNPSLVGVRQSIEEDTPSAWVVRNRRILYVGPGSEDTGFRRRYDHYKKNAFLLAPIISRSRVIGVLSVTDRKDDDSFNAQEQEFLLTLAGQVISTVENQQMEERLRRSRADIQRKNVELRNLERIRNELFNMIIHDLKGPLSEIVANLDILSYTTTGDNLEFVQTAQSGCDTLFRMISDLLDITRLEEGCLSLVCEKIDPAALIHESVLCLHGMAGARGVELTECIPESGGEPFPGDRGILLRILQNLLVNAVQHSPHGSRVEVGFERSGGGVVFHVQDQGPGISPEFHRAVFDKFFQITKKRDGRRYSTGLGLTFCRMAVEAHRGTIHVESDGKRGSRFVFSIPGLR